MSYASLVLVLLLLVNVSPVAFVQQEQEKETTPEFVVLPLSESVQVQTKCGEYLGYNMYPGVTEKCVSFNYGEGDSIFIKTAAISTMKVEIDDGKEEPTVQVVSPSEVVFRMSKTDYDKEKDCLPEPEQK
jgi:hypothetical protein